jgi:hypothetical protein
MPPESQTIRDIELPLIAQDDTGLLFFVAVTLVFFAIVGILLYVRRRSARVKALRAVKRLSRQRLTESVDHQACAFEIASLLRHGLNLRQVSAGVILPDPLREYRPRWRLFVDNLDTARYTPSPVTIDTLQWLFRDAEFWLKRWP